MQTYSAEEKSIAISDIKELLNSEGYDFELGPDRLDNRLLASCNKIQRKRLEKAFATRKETLRLERLYQFPDNIKHAHLLFSHDRRRILHSFKWIIENLPDDVRQVADVGCATGTLPRLISHYCPQSSVLGVDRAANLIAAAKKLPEVENIRYEVSDMANLGKFGIFDTIVSACGIEVPFLPQPSDEELLANEGARILPDYRRTISNAYASMLAGVRGAVEENGRLIAVFRIPTLVQFTHLVDVASECGWRLETPISNRITAGDEHFFAAIFKASEPHKQSE